MTTSNDGLLPGDNLLAASGSTALTLRTTPLATPRLSPRNSKLDPPAGTLAAIGPASPPWLAVRTSLVAVWLLKGTAVPCLFRNVAVTENAWGNASTIRPGVPEACGRPVRLLLTTTTIRSGGGPEVGGGGFPA